MAGSSWRDEGISLHHLILQLSLMCVVLYLWSSPLIQPVKIMVVLVHEMSHGFMALVTGGKILEIKIGLDEGGACETEGGLPLLIVSAGYLGSMLFGGMILYLSTRRLFVSLVYGVLTLILGAAVFTVLEGSFSRTFACSLGGSFIFLGFLAPGFLGGFFLRVMGTVSCLYSIVDIYSDTLANGPAAAVQNDAVVFAQLSGIPAETVGAVWLAVSVIFFLMVLKASVSDGSDRPRRVGGLQPARA